MSTIAQTQSLPFPAVVAPGDARFVIRDASWELYDRLSDAVGEGRNIRLAFDGKDLEVMTTGPFHEDLKELSGSFVKEVAVELDVDYRGLGQTTWKRSDLRRGLEADLCFYFDRAKLAASEEARERKSNDVADYPVPDLAVEIDISPSKVDRPGIYAAMKVPEIWRFHDDTVSILQLTPAGDYVESDTSMWLWIRADEIKRWVLGEDSRKLVMWTHRLRAWLESEIYPRVYQSGD